MVVQMPDIASGSLVYQIDPLSYAKEVLKLDDVILEVDGDMRSLTSLSDRNIDLSPDLLSPKPLDDVIMEADDVYA